MTSSAIHLRNPTLSVAFTQVGDRFHHEIVLRHGDQFVPIMRSIEGDASNPWPPSPPLQQVVSESIANDGANVLLGVGLSGNGHWSIAVENKIADKLESLVFDVACKNSKPAEYLGSRYSIEDCWQASELRDDAFTLKHRDQTLPDVRVRVSIGRLQFDSATNGCEFASLKDPAVTATHRWCYAIDAS